MKQKTKKTNKGGVWGENSENVKQKCENFALVVAAFVQA